MAEKQQIKKTAKSSDTEPRTPLVDKLPEKEQDSALTALKTAKKGVYSDIVESLEQTRSRFVARWGGQSFVPYKEALALINSIENKLKGE